MLHIVNVGFSEYSNKYSVYVIPFEYRFNVETNNINIDIIFDIILINY